MKSLLKLGIPILLAVLAAVGNRMYLEGKLATETYVSVNTQLLVADGERFDESQLQPVELYVAKDSVLKAVKWSDRTILYRAPIRRDFEAGELVMLSDVRVGKPDLHLNKGEVALQISLAGVDVEPSLLRVGREVGFVVHVQDSDETPGPASGNLPQKELGPFRLVSVGDDTELESLGDDGSRRTKLTTISVATELDPMNHILTDDARRLVNAAKYRQILALTLRRFKEAEPPRK
jgi:hypothetical protein